MPAARKILIACLGFAAAPVLAQGGPDELWGMTMRMEIAGMPPQAVNQSVCMQKGETQPDKMSQDKNCKVTEQRKTGNTFSWKVVCTGRDAMTGEGQMTRSGSSMNGRMRMQGKSGGESMDMTIVYSGKLSGTCNAKTYQDPQVAAMQQQVAAAQAQSNAELARVCTEAMDKYQTMMFEAQHMPCVARKAEYCTRVAKMTQSMRTPAGYRSAMKIDALHGKGWEQTAQFCGVTPGPVRAEACRSANGARDWSFVAGYCPAEAKKIAAEHCAGRDYTAAMSSEYKAICQRYARAGDDERATAPASTAPKPTPAAPAAPSAADTVLEGANQLRKLFGR